jgi:hypothetical protein
LLSKVKKPTTNYFSGNKVVSIAKFSKKESGGLTYKFAFGHSWLTRHQQLTRRQKLKFALQY